VIRALVVVLAAGLAACGSADPSASPSDAGPERRAAVDALAAEVWAPAYAAFAESSAAMVDAVGAACAGPSAASLEAARAAWAETSERWLEKRPLRFGPVRTERLAGAILFAIDAEKIDRLVTEERDPSLLGTRAADVKGLAAIEYLLHGADHPIDPMACAYAEEAARLVAAPAADLAGAWETYPAELAAMPAQEVLDLAINELIFALRELEMQRLAPAAGLVAPGSDDDVEGAAERGAAEAAALARGARIAYEGGPSGGIASLVAALSSDADGRFRQQLQTAETALGSGDPSFATADPATLQEALEAAGAARTTLATEISSLLGVTLMLGDSDGDS
jgi:Imelysin